jgi:hypothetical protein
MAELKSELPGVGVPQPSDHLGADHSGVVRGVTDPDRAAARDHIQALSVRMSADLRVVVPTCCGSGREYLRRTSMQLD